MQTGIGASPLPLFEYIIPVVTIITILDVSYSKTEYFQIAELYYIFQNLVYPLLPIPARPPAPVGWLLPQPPFFPCLGVG